MNSMKIHGRYFYGNKISEYGLQNGRVDYRAFAKAFDAVMCNDIMKKTWEWGEWEQISGGVDYDEIDELKEQLDELESRELEMIEENQEGTPEYKELEEKIDELKEQLDELENYEPEIFQWFIVSDNAVNLLKEAGEICYYCSFLDLYIWGVDHWGTSWDYVLTSIPVELDESGDNENE